MFADQDPAVRFLVADEVGLGKTHVAKGVIAQVIDHLRRTGDARHDIIYVCSNAAIARQNVRKLTPEGIEPLEDVGRLTMLPLAELDDGDDGQTGVNLLAITPGTSLKFGHQTGRFRERCLAYTFLRAHWGASVMATARARRIFWEGVRVNPDERLRFTEQLYGPRIMGSLDEFAEVLTEVDRSRQARGNPTVRELFDDLVDKLKWKRRFPHELQPRRKELIGEVRGIMARVGIAALQPDLVVLDEFQRFKDLLQPEPDNFAADLAHRLFDYSDPETGRATRTLLLSATPYRMYTTADEIDGDHYEDFLATCSFLFQDPARVDRLRHRFRALRSALTSAESLDHAEDTCREIGAELRGVIARTERLAVTPDRDGMLCEWDAQVRVKPDDLRAYLRLGGLAETVHEAPDLLGMGSRPEGGAPRANRVLEVGAVSRQLHGGVQAEGGNRSSRGYLSLTDDDRRREAADDIAGTVAEALELRTSSYRVDIPSRQRDGHDIEFQPHRMRTRFAVAFGHQTLDEGGEVRIESVSRAFNSPFWPFVLTSTSIGQEGLDFHLWCHAVVHWNLPSNPVDLEQREGRVHRYKGHAVRRNLAAALGPDLLAGGLSAGVDPWNELFAMAVAQRPADDGEMVPYWVFHRDRRRSNAMCRSYRSAGRGGPAPKLRKTLAAYRLAFGQPRQEELVEFLGENLSDEELARLRIDLSPPEASPSVARGPWSGGGSPQPGELTDF